MMFYLIINLQLTLLRMENQTYKNVVYGNQNMANIPEISSFVSRLVVSMGQGFLSLGLKVLDTRAEQTSILNSGQGARQY